MTVQLPISQGGGAGKAAYIDTGALVGVHSWCMHAACGLHLCVLPVVACLRLTATNTPNTPATRHDLPPPPQKKKKHNPQRARFGRSASARSRGASTSTLMPSWTTYVGCLCAVQRAQCASAHCAVVA